MTHRPRGSSVLAALAALLLGAALVGTSAAATAQPATADARPASGPTSDAEPRVLADARAALGGQGRETTLALTRLRLAYPSLSTASKAAADRLLARPTDGAADPLQFGWAVAEATPVCSPSFCVHYVPSTPDAPPAVDADVNGVPDQVTTTLATMESVLDHHTRVLGYRPPITDGIEGGGPQFDVYLSQLADRGLYGFCAAEEKAPGQRFVYSGYCVLDNDFVEFPRGALPSLQVTAAHEFFHAIQFAYDASEDGWFMEATATWVEERYGDDIDDNRQYLRHGQLGRPRTPLDVFDATGEAQYGNWLFFERLSQRYGVDVVRRIWNLADATKGAPDLFSTAAVDRLLRREHSDLPGFYADFAAGNQLPAAFYDEGRAYRRSPAVRTVRLRPAVAQVRDTRRLDHLTSAAYTFQRTASLTGAWRLKVAVTGPPRSSGTAARLLVETRLGDTRLVRVTISDRGTGARTVVLDKSVRAVTLVLANASTRFKPCWKGTAYSCQGSPRDDDAAFAFTATLSR